MAAKKESRCWPGYEPVPGKPQHSEGSCRPKAESKTTPSEKNFRAKRKKQLDDWQKEHPKSPRRSAQHLAEPGKTAKTASKKKTAAKKKSAAKKATGKKKAAAKRGA
jgi:hypothetical protein